MIRRVEAQLEHMLASPRMPHALLITGPAGSGKRLLARRVAARFCLGVSDDAALAACPNYAEYGETPLPVAEVRAIVSTAALTGFNGGKRAFLLYDAHRMNPQAQNALLKTLEEPPADTLLLLTGSEAGFLPTIRSRCAILRVGAEGLDEVAATLRGEGVPAGRAALAARLSDGVTGLARQYASDEYMAFRAGALRCLETALFDASPFAETAALLAAEQPFGADKKKKPDADNAARMLACWRPLLRDALLSRAGAGESINTDCAALLSRVAARFTTAEIQGIIEALGEAEHALSFRASPVQTMDALLARLYGMQYEKE